MTAIDPRTVPIDPPAGKAWFFDTSLPDRGTIGDLVLGPKGARMTEIGLLEIPAAKRGEKSKFVPLDDTSAGQVKRPTQVRRVSKRVVRAFYKSQGVSARRERMIAQIQAPLRAMIEGRYTDGVILPTGPTPKGGAQKPRRS